VCTSRVVFSATTKAVVAKIYNHINFDAVNLVHILSAFWIWKVNSLSCKIKREICKNRSSLRNQ